MKKYSIVCPFRRANPYKRMMKATQEHRVVPNLLNREFKQNIPGKVLLTDITYLFYGSGKKPIYPQSKIVQPMRSWRITCQIESQWILRQILS